MASYSTNEFKGGLKIMLDGDPCSIIENEFVKPGKGQAFNRVKIRNLITGRVLEKTFKSGESVDGADVHETEMQYLYTDGEFWYFMDPESFEQVSADAKALGDRTPAQQHGMRQPGLTDDDVHAPVDSIRAVHIEGAGRLEHRRVPLRSAPVGVTGRIIATGIRLDLSEGDLGQPSRK